MTTDRPFRFFVRGLSILCLLALVGTAGCGTTTNWKKTVREKLPFGEEKEPSVGRPERMVAFWSDTVYYRAGEQPTRGLGGRIYFYDRNNEPIRVAGQLIVYGFDDSLPEPERQKAQKKFVYTPDQFDTHRSDSDLGISYSVWIPWDAGGSPRKEVSVLPVFTTIDGQLITGEHSRNLLSGPDDESHPKIPSSVQPISPPATPPTAPSEVTAGVRPAGYLVPAESENGTLGDSYTVIAPDRQSAGKMQTTTIRVPHPLQRKLLTERPAEPEETRPRQDQALPAPAPPRTLPTTGYGTVAPTAYQVVAPAPAQYYYYGYEQPISGESADVRQGTMPAVANLPRAQLPTRRMPERDEGRFERPRYQAPSSATTRPDAAGVPSEQYPEGLPSGLAPLPEAGTRILYGPPPPNAGLFVSPTATGSAASYQIPR